MEDEKYQRMEKLSKEFQEGAGKKFNRYLVLKSWWATNYVSAQKNTDDYSCGQYITCLVAITKLLISPQPE